MYADFDAKTHEVSIHGLTVAEAKVIKRFLAKDRAVPAHQLGELSIIDNTIQQLNQVLTNIALLPQKNHKLWDIF
ncbi:MAG: hypothetical protein EBX41_10440 [Chitinophagia bacterium]|nr:hypothetical protein [Chitinophagia bacterium]